RTSPFLYSGIARIVVDHHVQGAIVVEVSDGHSAAILVVISSDCHRHVGEPEHSISALSFVPQHHVVLVAVPGYVPPEFVRVESTGLVLSYVRDRAQDVGQSEVILLLPADPTVDHVNVLSPIIVVVEDRGTPEPAERIYTCGF